MIASPPHPLVQRIRGEFQEMPGLKLTLRQAQRLFNLDLAECETLLTQLIDTRFLARTSDGSFIHASSSVL